MPRFRATSRDDPLTWKVFFRMSVEPGPAARRRTRRPKAEPRARRATKPYAFRIEALRRAINYRKDYALRYARRLARLQEMESLGAGASCIQSESCEDPVWGNEVNRNKAPHPHLPAPLVGRDPGASAYKNPNSRGCTYDCCSLSNSNSRVPPHKGADRWGWRNVQDLTRRSATPSETRNTKSLASPPNLVSPRNHPAGAACGNAPARP
jgi:hypothetical protein